MIRKAYLSFQLITNKSFEKKENVIISNDDTKYMSFYMQGGNSTLSSKFKSKIIKDIQVCIDAFEFTHQHMSYHTLNAIQPY